MAITPLSRERQKEALRQRAQALSEASPPLLIAADRVAQSLIQGEHGRRRAGPGEDFWQYRPYSFGDAANRIDWRKSARSQKMLIRENEWAATNTLHVWASNGPGMAFRSDLAPVTKRDRAALLAVAAAIIAVKAGERITGLGSPHAPGHTRLGLSNLATWLTSGEEPRDDLPPPTRVARFSTCLLIGDFFDPLSAIAERITALAAQGARGHLVTVLDPAEEVFPYEGRTRFEEFSGRDSLTAGRAETLKAAYSARLADHRAGLKELLGKLDWTMSLHRTDRSAASALLSIYGALSGQAVVLPETRSA
ncbi:MAG: DUF58 domain-containing protein [Hyphomicrobiales bacterium]